MTHSFNRWKVRHRAKVTEAEPGDEQVGMWTREKIERMDADFCDAMRSSLQSAALSHQQQPETAAQGRARRERA